MTRIPPITPGTQAALAPLEQKIAAERGRVSPLYQVLLNSPPMAQGWEQLLSAVRNRNSLGADVREMVILRVAVLNRANYEFDAHVPHALKAGMTQAQIDAVREAVPSASLSTPQQLALALTDAMTCDIDVSDALYAQVAAEFGTQAQVDLMVTIAAYNMVSRFLIAAQVGH